MPTTAARLLALLGLLQARADWNGPELASRLAVTQRTVRKDVERLRELGYPVDAVRGPGGHYRLGVGSRLPPLPPRNVQRMPTPRFARIARR